MSLDPSNGVFGRVGSPNPPARVATPREPQVLQGQDKLMPSTSSVMQLAPAKGRRLLLAFVKMPMLGVSSTKGDLDRHGICTTQVAA